MRLLTTTTNWKAKKIWKRENVIWENFEKRNQKNILGLSSFVKSSIRMSFILWNSLMYIRRCKGFLLVKYLNEIYNSRYCSNIQDTIELLWVEFCDIFPLFFSENILIFQGKVENPPNFIFYSLRITKIDSFSPDFKYYFLSSRSKVPKDINMVKMKKVSTIDSFPLLHQNMP